MTEFSRPSLFTKTAEQSANVSYYQLEIDNLRQKVQRNVESVVFEYQEKLPEHQKIALESINTVIQPWWHELKDSGVLDSLHRFAQTKSDRQIHLLNSQPFLYPVEAIRLYELASQRDSYKQEAENQLRSTTVSGLTEFSRNFRELYQGRFYLMFGKDQSSLSYTFGAPNGPSGFISGVAEQSRRTNINVEDADEVISKVHPLPLIEFGSAIQSYEVSDKIENYLSR